MLKMDYIGSKAKLDNWIFSKINKHFSAQFRGNKVLLDCCSGTGIISRHAVNNGYGLITNDIQNFAHHIANGSTQMSKERMATAEDELSIINELVGVEGFFYNNFSEHSGRLYFTDDNAKKIDAVRQQIETIADQVVKSYLIYCGIEALSRVSNTTGVQAAFLKKLKTRAKQSYLLRKEEATYGTNISVYNEDIMGLLQRTNFRNVHNEDILYFDPPYNERQYGPNYHLYETFARYDAPRLHGMTGLRDWKQETNSKFCSRKFFLPELKKLIELTTAKYIFISYSSDGLVTKEELSQFILNNVDAYITIEEMPQKRYKADNGRKNNQSELKEYIFEVIKK
jgi:adenine-specific DNA-methyltransferase